MRLSDLVDPTIGTDGAGECLIGPYLPHSLVRLSPDVPTPQPTSGYRSDKPIARFTHTHVAGTGGQSRYGNVGLLPYCGGVMLSAPGPYEKRDESAAAGYYAVTLDTEAGDVRCELTSTPRCGVHRYHFPPGGPASIHVDAACVLQPVYYEGDFNGERPRCTGSYIEFVGEGAYLEIDAIKPLHPSTAKAEGPVEIIGRGDFQGGWGHGFPYSVYFCVRFDRPVARAVAFGEDGLPQRVMASGLRSCGVVQFATGGTITARVGISYVSIAKARASLDRETQAFHSPLEFEPLRIRNQDAWDERLSQFQVTGGSERHRKLFYTLLTRFWCMPSDLGIDDEFPLWQSSTRHFTDYYCLWDSVRNANSLLGLIDPVRAGEMLNCLLDIDRAIGWLPDAWIAGHSAFIQGGSSCDVLFCEAVLKDLPGVEPAGALRAVRKHVESVSPDPYRYGRFIEPYRSLGYLPAQTADGRRILGCVSRTLEYAYEDRCIAVLAGRLGDRRLEEQCMQSSHNLWNLWHEPWQCFAPKDHRGEWVQAFHPLKTVPDCWNDPYFYEGNARQWVWNAHGDFPQLAQRMGGRRGFAEALDRFFDPADSPSGHYHSKETMLHVPWLYLWSDRPSRTAEVLPDLIDTYFRDARDGLSDNEDMGCQSAFFICAAIGLYPVMGQDIWLLNVPLFDRIEIALPGGTLVVDASQRPRGQCYIHGVTLNGRRLDRLWVRHHEIVRGATIALDLREHPSDFGVSNPPPAFVPASGKPM